MWQTVVVLLILVGVSIYLVRYYVRVYRAEGTDLLGVLGMLFPCRLLRALKSDSERAIFKDRSCQDETRRDCL